MTKLYWEFRQPRLTNTLRSMDPYRFHKLSFRLSDLVNARVEARIMTYPDEWIVFLNSVHCAALRFSFSLYDPPLPRQLPSGSRIEGPTIEIHDFSLFPRGQGLGTRTFFAFMDTIPTDAFGRILVKAQNERAAGFWSRFGFIPQIGTDSSSPSMSLELTPPAAGPKLRIQYK